MPQTKRMSAEEKRQVILGIYHSTQNVFVEKEIVTAASKAGVNTNSIVDVNQSLVDDGLVSKEKIGGSNYFWSFPAKKDRMMEIQHLNAIKHIDVLKKKIGETEAALMDAKRGREDDDEVQEKVDEDNKADEEKEDDGESKDNEENKTDSSGGDEIVIPPNKKAKTISRAQKLLRLQEIAKTKASTGAELERLKITIPKHWPISKRSFSSCCRGRIAGRTIFTFVRPT